MECGPFLKNLFRNAFGIWKISSLVHFRWNKSHYIVDCKKINKVTHWKIFFPKLRCNSAILWGRIWKFSFIRCGFSIEWYDDCSISTIYYVMAISIANIWPLYIIENIKLIGAFNDNLFARAWWCDVAKKNPCARILFCAFFFFFLIERDLSLFMVSFQLFCVFELFWAVYLY